MNNTSKNTNSLIISTDGTINAFINGQAYTLSPGGYYYPAALAAAKERNYEKLVEAIDLDKAVKSKSNGKVTFEDGVLRYNGSKIDNKLSERVVRMASEGETIKPIMLFIELCYLNPNKAVIDRLYDFMLCNSIMLGDNGYIVGYKGVRQTGYDWYSNTVLYEVGKESRIPRSECDEDSRNTCSSGLHLGNLDFARGWVRDGKLILCQINPENVTAIPEESGFPKLRCCAMDVLQDVSYLKTEGVFQDSSVYITGNNYDSDPNFEKDIGLNEDFDSEIDSEFGADSNDYLCGCRCESCNSEDSNSDSWNSDSDSPDSDNSNSNEDDDLDYNDSKYSNDNDSPTGWNYKDQQDYIDSWNYAVKNKALGPNLDYKEPIQRNQSGQFIKGNTPTAKRGPGGRFIKSN